MQSGDIFETKQRQHSGKRPFLSLLIYILNNLCRECFLTKKQFVVVRTELWRDSDNGQIFLDLFAQRVWKELECTTGNHGVKETLNALLTHAHRKVNTTERSVNLQWWIIASLQLLRNKTVCPNSEFEQRPHYQPHSCRLGTAKALPSWQWGLLWKTFFFINCSLMWRKRSKEKLRTRLQNFQLLET